MNLNNRNYFLANVCHVCKSKNTSHTCEICRMVFYCSPEHRRSNWLDHSEFCWAINKICGNGKYKSLWELIGGKDLINFQHEVANECTQILGRSLKPWEFEMIYHPRSTGFEKSTNLSRVQLVTLIIHRTPQLLSISQPKILWDELHCSYFLEACNFCGEFNWENLSCCKNCEFIYTCKKNHFRKDHKNWCETLKLYSEITICLSLNKYKSIGTLEIDFNGESMADVLMQNNKHDVEEFKNEYEKLQRALTSELLTYPLTVYHGLKSIDVASKRKLVILFIGAEIQAEVEPLNKWEKYLLHVLPNIEILNLIFLGPELQEMDQEFSADLCETCRKQKKELKVQYISGKFYHEYTENEPSQPDLICAMNSGMYRDFGFANENSWKETIKALFTRGNPPVLITEYTCKELDLDVKRIKSLCGGVHAIVQSTINPFASLKPGLNIISANESPVIFKNYSYTILKTKSKKN